MFVNNLIILLVESRRQRSTNSKKEITYLHYLMTDGAFS